MPYEQAAVRGYPSLHKTPLAGLERFNRRDRYPTRCPAKSTALCLNLTNLGTGYRREPTRGPKRAKCISREITTTITKRDTETHEKYQNVVTSSTHSQIRNNKQTNKRINWHEPVPSTVVTGHKATAENKQLFAQLCHASRPILHPRV